MSVYTMVGTEVRVVGGNFHQGEIDCYGVGSKPDQLFQGYISQFTADGGLTEIQKAIEKANNE